MRKYALALFVVLLGNSPQVFAVHYCDIDSHSANSSTQVVFTYDAEVWSCDDYSKLSGITGVTGYIDVFRLSTGEFQARSAPIAQGQDRQTLVIATAGKSWPVGTWNVGKMKVWRNDGSWLYFVVDEEKFCRGGASQCGVH